MIAADIYSAAEGVYNIFFTEGGAYDPFNYLNIAPAVSFGIGRAYRSVSRASGRVSRSIGRVSGSVGHSEVGNALSGLGRNAKIRNLNTLDEFGAGAGFSGVFDPATGKFLAYPSGSTRLANGQTPLNLVSQYGGHADVNRVLSELLGSTTNNRLGFSMVLDDAGNFAVRFNSRSVNSSNPNFPGRTVPVNLRQKILDAIKAATGRGAYSVQ